VRLWVQPLSGQDGHARWIVSATDKAALTSTPANGLLHLPVGPLY